MADGSGGVGGGPLEPKVVGWLWGFLLGAAFGAVAACVAVGALALHGDFVVRALRAVGAW